MITEGLGPLSIEPPRKACFGEIHGAGDNIFKSGSVRRQDPPKPFQGNSCLRRDVTFSQYRSVFIEGNLTGNIDDVSGSSG